jgi:hypothetical protein
MKLRRLNRPYLFLGLFIILAVFCFLASVKIWGEELLVKDWYRQEFVYSDEMTISEFGKANHLKSPILTSAFSLTSREDFQKKLKDLNLNQQKIINQVNKKLVLQAKNENILEKGFNEIIRRFLHNFGLVTEDIQRSGQPSPGTLWLHYKLFPFKSVINLAWEPEKSKDQVFEKTFCEERDIDYYRFSWNAGGPKDWGEVDKVIGIIDRCKKPVWIHCKGGKDRTGGLVAIWKKKKGYPMGLIFRDFQTHQIPAYTWVQLLFCGNPSNVQN